MPTYDYFCKDCHHEFQAFHPITKDPIKDCPECDETGTVNRRLGKGGGIIFKGSGFYETDYKKKEN